METKVTDVLVVGTGAAGLFCALHLPTDRQVTVITKDEAENSDSFLAQGGICVLPEESDYAAFYEDTMRAGHYENNPASVETMIRSSTDAVADLVDYGVSFARDKQGAFMYTREGGHSRPRILYHEDVTGRAITSVLLQQARQRENITLYEHTTMVDLLTADNRCGGLIVQQPDGQLVAWHAAYVVLACGGLGGLYTHSTNFPHITGDALALALRHGVRLQHVDYIQIHPTTLYSSHPGRRFLISESVRGEGALLLDKNGHRFADELLPRDKLTAAVLHQMEIDGTDHVWEDMRPIGAENIHAHFPHIEQRCLEEGYDPTKEPIPVVPAQHYFMGGIDVSLDSATSMERLFAVGETSCNGVHGRNRLASNSLLESLVFSKRAAAAIAAGATEPVPTPLPDTDTLARLADRAAQSAENRRLVLEEIEKEKLTHE